ncbi:polyamine ABC transporter substrate-binding protein [Streptomyces sp. WM6373]|uniref:polyamine ABC transporter substrate-binding protein n=1 Tax=Streptomyces TaxID=1883 RepID=UPI0006B003EB|nr:MULTISPECIES: spermidine/putrescine ABC transporter substrate-binding protein [unclassified Streptomyces]KOU29385.1 polyamine ABC transporter substrate-binding protein [Streptomyces sp. WM6373]KOU81884.1 polyamine ABC transporter substrate-binding protein [Streptomyces sp. XY66]KOU98180.1 polyamine ABC transporter substrate-binding protein [Streptomyces sp. XY58]KOV00068.1 polyamine ABC transporter substrate-binding protein [Streptomyces sp. XY37]KOV34557.1 polyamine ABC transporter substra
MPQLAFSRRAALAGLGAAGLSAALAGCGVPPAYVPEEGRVGADLSERDRSVAFSNWPLYIDTDEEDEESRPTLEAFSERTGIEVRYSEEINDNDEFFGKVSPALMNRQETGHDLVVVSDWMAARFVHLGWAQKMDRSAQPNVTRHLDPQLRSPAFDEGRLHTVPWQSGITGIAYNRKALGREIKSVQDLWHPDLAGKVTLFSGLDESFGLLMQGNGVDVTRWTESDFHRMCDQVESLVKKRHIRRFTGNDYTSDLSKGDVLACQAYSGDAIQLQADNPDIEFVVPEEGGELWAESLLVPNLARHKANAEVLVDHYYDPQVAAQLAASVNYVCPVPAAREVLAGSDDKETAELAENPLVFPDDDMRRRLAVARDISSAERRSLARRWNAIVGL